MLEYFNEWLQLIDCKLLINKRCYQVPLIYHSLGLGTESGMLKFSLYTVHVD